MSEIVTEHENDEMKKLKEIVDLQIKDQLFSIIFYNNESSAKFYELFHKKFHKYLKKNKKEIGNQTEKVRNFGEFSKKQIFNISHFFDNFIVDNCGDLSLDLIFKFDRKAVLYAADNTHALSDDRDFNNIFENKNNKSCFNCNSVDHNLNECPQPKNAAKILERRRDFQKSQNFQKSIPNVRYHEENEDAQQKFTPGAISEKLRFALGIAKNEIPPYIYKMRMLGYPPGYSLQAYFNSLLTVVDSEEDSFIEADLKNLKKKMVYNIIYPGFNAPMPKGIVDRSKEYGFPRIDPSIFIKMKPNEETVVEEKKIVPEVIDTTIISRGFYLDPLLLNTFPATRFWRNPPNLEEGSNLESLENIVENPAKVDSNPFSDESIPANRYMKILKLLKSL